jgi:CheY-like chemotaxis protein
LGVQIWTESNEAASTARLAPPSDAGDVEPVLFKLRVQGFGHDAERDCSFLLKRRNWSQAPTPDLIFLDVHLPRLDGIEVLRKVPGANKLPLCVLTGSEAERTPNENLASKTQMICLNR